MDDITALLMEKKQRSGGNGKEGDLEIERRSGEEKRPQIVSHGKWEGRKEQDDCVVWFPGEWVGVNSA